MAQQGIGKTALLSEYGWKENGHEAKIFIPSQSPEQIENCYRRIAERIDITNRDDLDGRALVRAVTVCLYLYDDARSYQDIAPYLPLRGDVVISSCNNSADGWPETVQERIVLDVLSEEEGITLAQKLAEKLDFKNSEKEARDVILKIPCYTSVFVHVFCLWSESGLSNEAFSKELDDLPALISKIPQKSDEVFGHYGKSLKTSIEEAMAEIRKMDGGAEAEAFLKKVARQGRTIPREELLALGDSIPARVDQLIEMLRNYSLVTLDDKGGLKVDGTIAKLVSAA